MFLVGHLRSELDTTIYHLRDPYYLVSSILLDFPEKDCYKNVTQMLVTIWSLRGISVRPHHHIIKSITRLYKDLFSLKKCLKKRRASPKHGKPF